MKHIRIFKAPLLALLALLSQANAAAGQSIEKQLLTDVTKQQVRDYWTVDFGRAELKGGYSALVPENDAKRLVVEIRKRLRAGYVSFVGTTHNLDHPEIHGVEIVIAPGKDQFDIIRLAASDGINFGIGSEDIIKKLKQWDTLVGINIWQAETDTVQLDLKRLPDDLKGFTLDVYKFCPDIVDQGTGDINGLQRDITKTKSVYLWWD